MTLAFKWNKFRLSPNQQKISCITAILAVIYTYRQTTQTAENMINQLTAYGRIGAKNGQILHY